MKSYLVIEWLKKYFNKRTISEKEITPVLHFSLLWNLFEHTYFSDEHRVNNNTLIKLAEEKVDKLPSGSLNHIYDYFQSRYFQNGVAEYKYSLLCLDKSNSRINGMSDYEFCETVLTNTQSTDINKLIAILFIIYRFRNNLFHGRKQPRTLNLYKSPFNVINYFIMIFIKTTQ